MADLWTILSSVAGGAGAALAAAGLFQAARSTRRAETFQHLRDVNDALTRLGDVDVGPLQAEILTYTRHRRDDLSAGASAYKSLLDTLELLSFAVEEGAVDRTIARKYLRSIVGGHMVPVGFLGEYQKVTNPYCYECLVRFAQANPLPPMKGYEQ
jgi:hypothetical protein